MYNFAQNRKQTDPEKIEFINGFVVKHVSSDKNINGLYKSRFIDGSNKQNIYFILTLIKIGSGLENFKQAPCKIEN